MKIDIKKIGPYLHSYVLPINVEFLTLPLIKAILFLLSNIGLKNVIQSVLERRIQIFEKIPNWLS
jgi:hypothetical protein